MAWYSISQPFMFLKNACIFVWLCMNIVLLFTSTLHILCKSLPKSLVFLYPRLWKRGNQLWGWPGLLSKMLQISHSIVFNTNVMWRCTGAMQWALNHIQKHEWKPNPNPNPNPNTKVVRAGPKYHFWSECPGTSRHFFQYVDCTLL